MHTVKISFKAATFFLCTMLVALKIFFTYFIRCWLKTSIYIRPIFFSDVQHYVDGIAELFTYFIRCW